MEQKSKIDIAYEVIESKESPVAFKDLWVEVVTRKGLTEDEAKASISSFYTLLSIDGRFFNVGGNTWDLASRYKFEDREAKINDFEDDADEKVNDEESLEEEMEEGLDKEDKDDSDEDDSDEEASNKREDY